MSPSNRMRRLARALRSHPTEAEVRLWFHLRSRRTGGLRFRRQYPIGPYIVDFICLERRLVVEVDGGHHAESAGDRARDAWLAGCGLRVLRFWNNDVLRDTCAVLDRLMEVAETRAPSPPAPLPQAGEGREAHSSCAL